MTAHRLGLFFCSTVLFAAVAFGSEVVYQNDFSTRTSKMPVPDGRWHETSYVKGAVVNNYDNGGEIDPSVPYASLGDYQDSWFKVYSSSAEAQPDVLVRPSSTVKEADLQPGDPQNPYLSVKGDGTVNVATPIYNDFSSGVVRISCDIRAFVSLTANTAYVRVRPVFKKNLVFGSADTATYVTTFGPWRQDVDKEGVTVVERHACLITVDDKGKSSPVNISKELEKGHWYRYVVELNLDAQRESGCLYDLGETHPTGETAGELVNTFHRWGAGGEDVTELPFLHDVDETTGPISGLQLSFSKVKSNGSDGKLDLSVAPAVDNLKVEWKAPGAADFESVYENDFATRRYRTLSAAASVEGAYAVSAAGEGLVDRMAYDYNDTWTTADAKYFHVPKFSDKQALQKVGYDGWRRIEGSTWLAVGNWAKTSAGGTASGENGGAALRASDGSSAFGTKNFVSAVTPIGQSFTDGKVRLAADIKVPETWLADGSKPDRYDAGVFLADAAIYESNVQAGHWAVRSGITGNNVETGSKSSKRFYPYWNKGKDAKDDFDGTTDTEFASNAWYRVVLTADMDRKSASLEIWNVGEHGQAGAYEVTEKLFAKDSISFRSEIADISMIGVFASAPGASSKKSFIAFDNIKVERQVGGKWQEAYVCPFSSRTRTYDSLVSGKLVGTFNNDDGSDHWIRRGNGSGECRVVDVGNPAAAAWVSGNSGSSAVHSFGRLIKRSGSVQVDVRPPSFWGAIKGPDGSSTVSHYASVVCGGDRFVQGCQKDGTAFTSVSSAMTFGFFDNATSAKSAAGLCTNVSLYAWNGDMKGGGARAVLTPSKEIDPTHWYRFRADFVAPDNAWSVAVYDLGAEHPAYGQPDGELVASRAGLKFRNDTASGVSAFCFNTQGNTVVNASDPADPGMALYDNVIVTEEDRGTAIILR